MIRGIFRCKSDLEIINLSYSKIDIVISEIVDVIIVVVFLPFIVIRFLSIPSLLSFVCTAAL